MIASNESFEPHSSEQLPNSRRVYVPGTIFVVADEKLLLPT